MGISYITRRDLVSALSDNSPTSRGNAAVDRAIEAGSRAVDALCRRQFFPTIGTRVLQRDSAGENLWFDADEVLSLTSLTVDGALTAASTYRLSPNAGPPYTSLKFTSTRTFTRDNLISIAGVFGSCDDQVTAGLAAEAMDLTETDLDLYDGSLIGVGDLVKIDTERMQVTGRTWLASGQTLQTPMTASAANTTVAVTTGSAFHEGESLMLDAEQMLVTDVSGNNVIVKRAQGGTVLAIHTGSAISASRTLTVVRGAAGSTAATHLINAPMTKLQAPALVRSLALAEAIDTVLQEAAGYARVVGTGETARPASGGGLDPLRAQVYAAHGRKGRQR